MPTPTNPKLHVVAPPVWRPFHGVSVLYDPPGCAALTGLHPLEGLPAAHDRDDRLYRVLRGCADHVAAAGRRDGVDVALLPWRTYHVTLCDTINDGNLGAVRADRRDEVSAFLGALPDSLLGTSATIRMLRDRVLPRHVASAPIRFGFERLVVRGLAIVAELAPVPDGRSGRVQRHEQERARYVTALGDEFGIEVPNWHPHVTLGYLGSRADADRLGDLVTRSRSARVAGPAAGVTVTFRSAALYGFTDMASYWRLGT